MTDQTTSLRNERFEVARERLTTPRAAAIAGILFAILFIVAFFLIRLSIPETIGGSGSIAWLQSDTGALSLGFNLIPFAGIAFLWFMGVIRDRLGKLEDQFFATVFLGSGLLFLAMLFAAGAIAGGILTTYIGASESMDASGVSLFTSATIYTIIRVYAIRMAGVFMISLSTISLRTRIMPRPFVLVSYALALVMLLTVNATPWLMLIFPGWVFVVSIYILIFNLRREEANAEAALPS